MTAEDIDIYTKRSLIRYKSIFQTHSETRKIYYFLVFDGKLVIDCGVHDIDTLNFINSISGNKYIKPSNGKTR